VLACGHLEKQKIKCPGEKCENLRISRDLCMADLKILHIATTLQGGAGIGARRYHEALLRAGVDSRFLVADLDGVPESPNIAKVKRRYPRGWERLVRGTGLFPAAETRMARRVAEADKVATQASYELFSLPFSSYPVEEHPWIREADEIHIHWVAGFLDWPRFFRRGEPPRGGRPA